MTKQEFLDQKKHSTQDWATLQLLLGMSKTQLLTAVRHAKMMRKTLYTTESRNQTFDFVFKSLCDAYELAETGQLTNNGNPLENQK